jgi:hypothetical protein
MRRRSRRAKSSRRMVMVAMAVQRAYIALHSCFQGVEALQPKATMRTARMIMRMLAAMPLLLTVLCHCSGLRVRGRQRTAVREVQIARR